MKNIFKKLFKKQSVVKDSIYKKLKNSSDIEKIFKAFDKHSDNSEIRFVGGCIRKFLKNEKIDDIDLATNVTPEITQKILCYCFLILPLPLQVLNPLLNQYRLYFRCLKLF